MEIRLFIDKVRLAVQKRFGKTKKKGGRSYAAWAAKGHIKQPLVSFVIQSHDKSLQVCHILPKLRQMPDSEIIVIDDGSSLEHTARLARELTGANEFLVRANDLYENITYDKCIRFSNGRYIALLQDDDDFADGIQWAERAVALFRQHPDMAILGGCDGRKVHFIERDGQPTYVSESMVEDLQPSAIPSAAKSVNVSPTESGATAKSDTAVDKKFRFVMTVNRAPMWLNRELYQQHLRHIDYAFTPFQSDDYELCLRAWTKGLKVGWYDARFTSLSAGGMRLWNNAFTKEMTARNAPRLHQLYAEHEATILADVEKANVD